MSTLIGGRFHPRVLSSVNTNFVYVGERLFVSITFVLANSEALYQGTHVLGLTATASKAVYDAAISTLHMANPVVIASSPERPNIFLSVVDKKDVIEVVQDIARVYLSSHENGPSTFPKTLVFCRRYRMDLIFPLCKYTWHCMMMYMLCCFADARTVELCTLTFNTS